MCELFSNGGLYRLCLCEFSFWNLKIKILQSTLTILVRIFRGFTNVLKVSKSVFKEYQWCFSKIVEKLDSIFIPYFDSEAQEQRRFYPDFIFWLKHKRSGAYKIIFLDPKGLKLEANARDKLRGFKELFCDKALSFEGIEVSVDLKYYNKDSNVAKDFHKYIASRVCEVFARCFE